MILDLVIDEEGSINEIESRSSIADPDLAEEAISLVKCLPKFIPAFNTKRETN